VDNFLIFMTVDCDSILPEKEAMETMKSSKMYNNSLPDNLPPGTSKQTCRVTVISAIVSIKNASPSEAVMVV
jgi:hypothetical protein